uniref:VWFA domain-containing protein n=1 Tax=Aliivibrio wodanis TaxID=80852 RepID=A0A5Q4Z014_9GAMM|nr:hypothetical protein AW0309160_03356 [Aliivibrio wodanis]
MNYSLSKQSGHAAILFAMIIPVLFGLFTIASDGARALQSKARIQDAAEVATLAISAHNADNTDSNGAGSGSQVNRDIATDFIEQYMIDMTQVSDLKVIKKTCDQIKECKDGLVKGDSRFFQYQVEARTDHKSWFPGNEAIVGFGDSFTVAGAATARKYQSEAVDVVFAADFSGSMKNSWAGGSNPKYLDLINVMNDVIDELEKFNELNNGQVNKVSVIPFNTNTRSYTDYYNRTCFVDQLKYNGNNVNYNSTLSSIFVDKSNCESQITSSSIFDDILLTEDFSRVKTEINNFYPNDGTASYSGIIRGAQILNKGKNPRRILIVLSDGYDEPNYTPVYGKPSYIYYGEPSYKKIGEELIVAHNLCGVISNELNNDKTDDGRKIEAKMAVVGFDYPLDQNIALKECVGVNNVYKAENKQDILDRILELITEEIGHLK